MHGSQTTVEDARWIWHLAGRDESGLLYFSTLLEGGDDAETKVRMQQVPLAGENAGHSKHSIQERRSIVWQQNTSAVNARSLHSLSFSAPVKKEGPSERPTTAQRALGPPHPCGWAMSTHQGLGLVT